MGLTEMYKIIIATIITLINTIFIMISIILLTQVSSVYTDLFQILMVYILLHVVIGLLRYKYVMYALYAPLCALIRVKYGYTILERNHILFYINTIGDMFKSGLTFNKN